ncbi:hypothetical protein [Mediterraneibacter gnavus]|uniref:hypothetical protein n=1 Tax=Mediterraneibacter gnavus TaxID=33038 RepID=UPI0004648D0D|nr:hypothetical protein [Mediterraneibacter gnavus]
MEKRRKQTERITKRLKTCLMDTACFQDDHGTSYQNPENTTQGTLEVKNVAGYNVMALKGGQATSGYWNGGMKTLTIPADSEGRGGAKNFYCYTQHWFETGLMGQTGAQTIAFLTGDNKVICAMSINKSDSVGNTARIEWFCSRKHLNQTRRVPTDSLRG